MNHLVDVERLVLLGESESLEFKRSLAERAGVAKTVCAMLNSAGGGTILIGVQDDRGIVGCEVGSESHNRLRGELEKIDPAFVCPIDTLSLPNGRSVIRISVPGGTGVYRYDGRPYARVMASTIVIPESTYQGLVLERHHSANRWENARPSGLTVADLDHNEIRRTIELGRQTGRIPYSGVESVAEILEKLGLMEAGVPLNGAFVLFGTADVIRRRFPQCRLRLARFRGKDKQEFLDNRQIVGSIFEQLQQAESFLQQYIPVAGQIVEPLFTRLDMPAYSFEALREAVVNALCHRDYAEAGGGVDVAIFDDHIEVTSTGPLRFGLTVEELKREHQSRLWNPLIAGTLYLRGVIESWGRGTLRIVELSKSLSREEPEFVDNRSSFTVRLFARGYLPPTSVSHEVTELQRRILAALIELGPSSVSTIAGRLDGGSDVRSISRNLQLLRSFGLVSLQGERRWAKWRVVPR